MTVRSNDTNLPPQLRDLSTTALDLSEPLRSVLQEKLSSAPPNATPEQVLADTCAQLGYLPEEAKRTAAKVLTA